MHLARVLHRRVPLARAFSSAGKPSPSPTERLIIFDTTLRDGEQSPGCTLQLHEKVAVAHHLSSLGVDVCEAGFPVASRGDFDAVATIAREIGPRTEGRYNSEPMCIAGLARAREKDIDVCYDAVKAAPRHRVHLFIATSDIHLKHKLNLSWPAAIERASACVRHAASMCKDVEFSAEDAGRSDPAFLVDFVSAMIESGATTINVPDTVGYTLPHEYGAIFAHLRAAMAGRGPAYDRVIWSAHTHNDLGLATANALAAVAAGARQVECTINGIGERAGNAALEEVVMAVTVRPHQFSVALPQIVTQRIMRTSRVVSQMTGTHVQPNKAIVGANAFAHESGIHQDGMLKNASTYEIMTPASVGVSKTSLVLGKHSGRHAYASRLRELGFTALSATDIDALVDKFKALADEKKIVTDADMQSLVLSRLASPVPVWTLTSLQVYTGVGLTPTATVCLTHGETGKEVQSAEMGTGPIDAVYKAIKKVVGRANDLVHFSVNSVTDGQNALGEVTIRIEPAREGDGKRVIHGLKRVNGAPAPAATPAEAAAALYDTLDEVEPSVAVARYAGTAVDKDIVVAAAHAYVQALNRLLAADAILPVVGAGEGGGV